MSGSQSWRAKVPRGDPKAVLAWLLDPLILTARDSPVLLAFTALLTFVIWGGIAGFGVPYLFWHDTPWVQLVAGISTALVAWELAFIGYLLASRDDAWSEQNPAEGWLLRTAVPHCLILGLAPLGPIEPDSWREFEAGLVIGSTIVIGLRRIVSLGLAPGRMLDRLLVRALPEWLELPRFEHRVQTVYFGLMLGIYVIWTAASWLRIDPWLPAAIALSLALGLVAAIYGIIRFHLDRNRVFVYAAAVLVFTSVQYLTFGRRHRLAGLDYDARVALANAPLASAERAGLLDQAEVLDAWLGRVGVATQPTPQPKPKLVVIAISGGGLRSATWSMSVLIELEREIVEFPDHVRLMTGASGGMVAAAHWVATLQPPGSQTRHDGRDLVAEIGQNALDSVAVHLALPLPGDRGVALERALERNSDDALSIGLRELRSREAAGWCPSLLFSPVIVEDGREMLFSNLDLAALTSSNPWLEPDLRCEDQVEPCSHSLTAIEFFKLFPDADPKLSTVVRLSASFPYVSPAVQIATTPPRRLVDAGYTDPFGVNLAARWIAHNRAWLREHTSGVVLVQIRDTPDRRRELGGESGYAWIERSLSGLVAPGEAVVSSRRTSTAFRNDNLVATLAALFEDADGELPFFTTVVFELEEEASLSWALTVAERDRIRASLASDANRQALDWLVTWWRG